MVFRSVSVIKTQFKLGFCRQNPLAHHSAPVSVGSDFKQAPSDMLLPMSKGLVGSKLTQVGAELPDDISKSKQMCLLALSSAVKWFAHSRAGVSPKLIKQLWFNILFPIFWFAGSGSSLLQDWSLLALMLWIQNPD